MNKEAAFLLTEDYATFLLESTPKNLSLSVFIEASPELVSKLPDRTICKYLLVNLPSRALLNPRA
ncbi:hypothetical protein [Candidatus Odyssella thessalonicensis]|uniref:hypothetical protein n=1 Tax=Candidatus Odyssella thessalonicensis TaxID=84647 RepID=UPI000225B4FD|nr:hypothetical protein [Candidatus Odyssella thessalonicensis]